MDRWLPKGPMPSSEGAFERFLTAAIATIITIIFSWRMLDKINEDKNDSETHQLSSSPPTESTAGSIPLTQRQPTAVRFQFFSQYNTSVTHKVLSLSNPGHYSAGCLAFQANTVNNIRVPMDLPLCGDTPTSATDENAKFSMVGESSGIPHNSYELFIPPFVGNISACDQLPDYFIDPASPGVEVKGKTQETVIPAYRSATTLLQASTSLEPYAELPTVCANNECSVNSLPASGKHGYVSRESSLENTHNELADITDSSLEDASSVGADNKLGLYYNLQNECDDDNCNTEYDNDINEENYQEFRDPGTSDDSNYYSNQFDDFFDSSNGRHCHPGYEYDYDDYDDVQPRELDSDEELFCCSILEPIREEESDEITSSEGDNSRSEKGFKNLKSPQVSVLSDEGNRGVTLDERLHTGGGSSPVSSPEPDLPETDLASSSSTLNEHTMDVLGQRSDLDRKYGIPVSGQDVRSCQNVNTAPAVGPDYENGFENLTRFQNRTARSDTARAQLFVSDYLGNFETEGVISNDDSIRRFGSSVDRISHNFVKEVVRKYSENDSPADEGFTEAGDRVDVDNTEEDRGQFVSQSFLQTFSTRIEVEDSNSESDESVQTVISRKASDSSPLHGRRLASGLRTVPEIPKRPVSDVFLYSSKNVSGNGGAQRSWIPSGGAEGHVHVDGRNDRVDDVDQGKTDIDYLYYENKCLNSDIEDDSDLKLSDPVLSSTTDDTIPDGEFENVENNDGSDELPRPDFHKYGLGSRPAEGASKSTEITYNCNGGGFAYVFDKEKEFVKNYGDETDELSRVPLEEDNEVSNSRFSCSEVPRGDTDKEIVDTMDSRLYDFHGNKDRVDGRSSYRDEEWPGEVVQTFTYHVSEEENIFRTMQTVKDFFGRRSGDRSSELLRKEEGEDADDEEWKEEAEETYILPVSHERTVMRSMKEMLDRRSGDRGSELLIHDYDDDDDDDCRSTCTTTMIEGEGRGAWGYVGDQDAASEYRVQSCALDRVDRDLKERFGFKLNLDEYKTEEYSTQEGWPVVRMVERERVYVDEDGEDATFSQEEIDNVKEAYEDGEVYIRESEESIEREIDEKDNNGDGEEEQDMTDNYVEERKEITPETISPQKRNTRGSFAAMHAMFSFTLDKFPADEASVMITRLSQPLASTTRGPYTRLGYGDVRSWHGPPSFTETTSSGVSSPSVLSEKPTYDQTATREECSLGETLLPSQSLSSSQDVSTGIFSNEYGPEKQLDSFERDVPPWRESAGNYDEFVHNMSEEDVRPVSPVSQLAILSPAITAILSGNVLTGRRENHESLSPADEQESHKVSQTSNRYVCKDKDDEGEGEKRRRQNRREEDESQFQKSSVLKKPTFVRTSSAQNENDLLGFKRSMKRLASSSLDDESPTSAHVEEDLLGFKRSMRLLASSLLDDEATPCDHGQEGSSGTKPEVRQPSPDSVSEESTQVLNWSLGELSRSSVSLEQSNFQSSLMDGSWKDGLRGSGPQLRGVDRNREGELGGSGSGPTWMDRSKEGELEGSVSQPKWMDRSREVKLEGSGFKPTWMDRSKEGELEGRGSQPRWMDKDNEGELEGTGSQPKWMDKSREDVSRSRGRGMSVSASPRTEHISFSKSLRQTPVSPSSEGLVTSSMLGDEIRSNSKTYIPTTISSPEQGLNVSPTLVTWTRVIPGSNFVKEKRTLSPEGGESNSGNSRDTQEIVRRAEPEHTIREDRRAEPEHTIREDRRAEPEHIIREDAENLGSRDPAPIPLFTSRSHIVLTSRLAADLSLSNLQKSAPTLSENVYPQNQKSASTTTASDVTPLDSCSVAKLAPEENMHSRRVDRMMEKAHLARIDFKVKDSQVGPEQAKETLWREESRFIDDREGEKGEDVRTPEESSEGDSEEEDEDEEEEEEEDEEIEEEHHEEKFSNTTKAQTQEQPRGKTQEQPRGQTAGQLRGYTPGQLRGHTPEQLRGHTPGLPSGHTPGLPSGHTPGLPSGHTPGLPSGHTPGLPSGHTPGLPSGHTPGLPSGHTPGLPSGHTPGLPSGHTPGLPSGHTPGLPSGHTPGLPSGHTPGQLRGHTPGQPSGHTPGLPSGHTPGLPSGHTPGLPSGHTPGQPSGHTHGQPSGHTPGQPSGHTPGLPSGHTPGLPSGHTPGQPSGHTPGQPNGNTPGQPRETSQNGERKGDLLSQDSSQIMFSDSTSEHKYLSESMHNIPSKVRTPSSVPFTSISLAHPRSIPGSTKRSQSMRDIKKRYKQPYRSVLTQDPAAFTPPKAAPFLLPEQFMTPSRLKIVQSRDRFLSEQNLHSESFSDGFAAHKDALTFTTAPKKNRKYTSRMSRHSNYRSQEQLEKLKYMIDLKPGRSEGSLNVDCLHEDCILSEKGRREIMDKTLSIENLNPELHTCLRHFYPENQGVLSDSFFPETNSDLFDLTFPFQDELDRHLNRPASMGELRHHYEYSGIDRSGTFEAPHSSGQDRFSQTQYKKSTSLYALKTDQNKAEYEDGVQRPPSAHELRISKSLQKLNVPNWYRKPHLSKSSSCLHQYNSPSSLTSWALSPSNTSSLSTTPSTTSNVVIRSRVQLPTSSRNLRSPRYSSKSAPTTPCFTNHNGGDELSAQTQVPLPSEKMRSSSKPLALMAIPIVPFDEIQAMIVQKKEEARANTPELDKRQVFSVAQPDYKTNLASVRSSYVAKDIAEVTSQVKIEKKEEQARMSKSEIDHFIISSVSQPSAKTMFRAVSRSVPDPFAAKDMTKAEPHVPDPFAAKDMTKAEPQVVIGNRKEEPRTNKSILDQSHRVSISQPSDRSFSGAAKGSGPYLFAAGDVAEAEPRVVIGNTKEEARATKPEMDQSVISSTSSTVKSYSRSSITYRESRAEAIAEVEPCAPIEKLKEETPTRKPERDQSFPPPTLETSGEKLSKSSGTADVIILKSTPANRPDKAELPREVIPEITSSPQDPSMKSILKKPNDDRTYSNVQILPKANEEIVSTNQNPRIYSEFTPILTLSQRPAQVNRFEPLKQQPILRPAIHEKFIPSERPKSIDMKQLERAKNDQQPLLVTTELQFHSTGDQGTAHVPHSRGFVPSLSSPTTSVLDHAKEKGQTIESRTGQISANSSFDSIVSVPSQPFNVLPPIIIKSPPMIIVTPDTPRSLGSHYANVSLRGSRPPAKTYEGAPILRSLDQKPFIAPVLESHTSTEPQSYAVDHPTQYIPRKLSSAESVDQVDLNNSFGSEVLPAEPQAAKAETGIYKTRSWVPKPKSNRRINSPEEHQKHIEEPTYSNISESHSTFNAPELSDNFRDLGSPTESEIHEKSFTSGERNSIETDSNRYTSPVSCLQKDMPGGNDKDFDRSFGSDSSASVDTQRELVRDYSYDIRHAERKASIESNPSFTRRLDQVLDQYSSPVIELSKRVSASSTPTGGGISALRYSSEDEESVPYGRPDYGSGIDRLDRRDSDRNERNRDINERYVDRNGSTFDENGRSLDNGEHNYGRSDIEYVRTEQDHARTYSREGLDKRDMYYERNTDYGSEESDFDRRDDDSVNMSGGSVREDVGYMRTDVGPVRRDIGSVRSDSGPVRRDSGPVRRDSGSVREDVGYMRRDSGSERRNDGSMRRDSGSERRNDGSMRRDSGSERRTDGSMRRDSGSERRTDGSMRRDSGSGGRDVGPVRKNNGSGSRESRSARRQSDYGRRDSDSGESGYSNRQSGSEPGDMNYRREAKPFKEKDLPQRRDPSWTTTEDTSRFRHPDQGSVRRDNWDRHSLPRSGSKGSNSSIKSVHPKPFSGKIEDMTESNTSVSSGRTWQPKPRRSRGFDSSPPKRVTSTGDISSLTANPSLDSSDTSITSPYRYKVQGSAFNSTVPGAVAGIHTPPSNRRQYRSSSTSSSLTDIYAPNKETTV